MTRMHKGEEAERQDEGRRERDSPPWRRQQPRLGAETGLDVTPVLLA
jgi:hypothetical protein